jgi:GR25 family glycosyltransferase involved in LPS biosynthesis
MSQFIDKIIYINLDKREDRRKEIENELNTYGLTNYERFSAYETSGFGILGCANSHLQALKIARERGYKNVLIMEDDFVFVLSKEEVETALEKLFDPDKNIKFDVCMCSYKLNDGNIIENEPFLTKVKDAQTASGYIVNQHYYDTIIELYENTNVLLDTTRQHWLYANDQSWKVLQPNSDWFCFTKRFGIQRPGFSDNANAYMDYND